MPFVKQTRAPGMAFYVVAFVTAVYAALGAARLERDEGRTHPRVWLVVAAVIAVLALAGVIGAMAVTLAPDRVRKGCIDNLNDS